MPAPHPTDKGKAAYLEFAAKQVAALKGLGYRGAHIGGFGLSFKDIRQVIELSAQMEGQWREAAREISFPQKDEFFFYAKGPGDRAFRPGSHSERRKRAASRPADQLRDDESGP